MINRFKRAMALLMAAVMIVGSVSVTAEAKSSKKAVKSVKVSNVEFGTVVLKPKKSFKLKTKVTVTGKASKKVTYSSSKKKVATVSKSGKIKALKKGKTKITVKSKADKKKKVVVTVIVGTPVTKVTLDKQDAALTEGDTLTLNAVLSPQKPDVKKLNWSSDNTDVAEVSDAGVVTAKKEGTAVITVKAMDNSGKKAVCKVTVTKKTTPDNPKPDTPKPDDPKPDTPKPDDPTTEDTDFYDPKVEYDYNLEDTDSTAEDFDQLSIDVTDSADYEMKWYDNFEGESLDKKNWNVETHEPGWVNSELQSYNDDGRNIFVKDGNLILRSIREKDKDGKVVISSGRVNTMGHQDFKYGVFEVRAKVPEGKGFLPAFWMMPTNENLYGQWPRCGEIDIMEVKCQETDKLYGTIHYGNPHAESQGTYKQAGKDFASAYHTFTCNWEPGKITWYVDGIKFHEESDWHTTTEGQGTVAYPAPFDQPFYVILNLAVGGSWVGNPDSTTKINPAAFVIDYVKVWQKDEAAYEEEEENVIKPEKPPVVLREPDEEGNYTKNSDFSVKEDLTDEEYWSFATANGGEAKAEIVNDTKLGGSAIKISTTNKGSVDYSVQLLQHKIPLKQGNKYTLTFDAYAEEARTMRAAVGTIGDRGWKKYLDQEVNLTTAKQTFTCTFDMSAEDYADARIEFNMGKVEPTSTIYITNVKLKVTDTFEVDNSKTVRADGNCVYNGSFQEGEPTDGSKKGMEYWTTVTGANADAAAGVTNLKDGRRFHATVDAKADATLTGADFQLKQEGLPMLGNQKYDFSFEAEVENPKTITVDLAGETFEFTLNKGNNKYSKTFTANETLTNKDIVFNLGTCGEIWLDNIRVEESALIKNGSFNAGLAGFEPYVDSAADASYVVDSQQEDNAFDITIKDTGENEKNDWYIQLKQNNVPLVKDQCYKLSFKIKSSIDRKVKYAISRDGSKHKDDWTPYAEDTVELTASSKDYTTIEKFFKMEAASDPESVFNITMGSVGGTRITTQHRICIDDIVLEEIDESEMPKEPEVEAKEYDTNLFADPEMEEGTAWILQGKDLTGNSASIKEGKAVFEIASLGTNEWDVELKQENLTLEKDEYYVLSFDIKSDVDRKVKTKFQQNGGSYTPYFSQNIDLTAGETYHYTSEEFKMENKSDDKALFAIDMGNMEETLDTHHVEISNLCYKKVHHEGGEPSEEDPSEEDSTETLNKEKLTLEDVEKTVTEDDKQENIYDLQVSEKPVSLVAGYKYEISFTAYSENARTIQYGVQRDGSKDDNWGTYGDADVTMKLEADTATPIELEFVMPKTDKNAIFFINYAQKDVLGDVTFTNMSLKAVAEPDTTKPVNMLSGGVKSVLTSWENVGPEEFTVTLGDESAVTSIEDDKFQLQANDINIVQGKTYKISFKITSEDARKVKTGMQRDGYGRGDKVYTPYGFSEEQDLAAGTEKLIEYTFTMSEDTDDQAVFIIKLANPGGSEDDKTVTIKDLSLVEVTE